MVGLSALSSYHHNTPSEQYLQSRQANSQSIRQLCRLALRRTGRIDRDIATVPPLLLLGLLLHLLLYLLLWLIPTLRLIRRTSSIRILAADIANRAVRTRPLAIAAAFLLTTGMAGQRRPGPAVDHGRGSASAISLHEMNVIMCVCVGVVARGRCPG
jgi:hypothetical protein